MVFKKSQTDYTGCWQENETTVLLLGTVKPLWVIAGRFLEKLNIYLLYNPNHLLLDIYPEK